MATIKVCRVIFALVIAFLTHYCTTVNSMYLNPDLEDLRSFAHEFLVGSQKRYNNTFQENTTNTSTFFGQFTYDLKVNYRIDKDSWYDYIVIGAGTGGSVVASRLSEDPSVRVLLIEAGGKEDWINNSPTLFQFLQNTWRDYAYFSVPQKHCCGQLVNNQVPVPRGKLIGGSSSINGMGYQRCSSEDYDRWESVHGAQGWSYSDVFPYFIKFENATPDARLDLGYYSQQGFYTMGFQERSDFTETILDSIHELGYPVGDFNGRDAARSLEASSSINRGMRQSTGRAYLSRASFRPNLDVLIFARADRILFDEDLKKAIGVEYTVNSEKNRVFAGKEIVVSAGVIETPKLLKLSGIGPEDELKPLGIPVLVDLPGVGKNFHDQPVVALPFETIPEAQGNDSVSTPSGVVWSFLKTKLAKDRRPNVELQIVPGLYGEIIPLDMAAWKNNWRSEITERYYMPYEGLHGFIIYALPTHPQSRGWVKLASKDPDQAPLINHNFLAGERDLDVFVEGCKIAYQITQSRTMRSLKPKFLGVVEACKHLPLFSDGYLRCMIPIMTNMFYHPVGTAKMGPSSDRLAVVDPELRVYGVKGLRVADASVMPETVSGHPMASIIMIGERCADFIKGRSLKPFRPPIHPM